MIYQSSVLLKTPTLKYIYMIYLVIYLVQPHWQVSNQ